MEIGLYEAKTHFSSLMARVVRGEQVTITKHGLPIANVVPVRQKLSSAAETIRKIRALRDRLPARKVSVKAMIAEGRR